MKELEPKSVLPGEKTDMTDPTIVVSDVVETTTDAGGTEERPPDVIVEG
jgi:hypothetical protein